jgi:CelD/BcsL family acetyltransferase involved in cellulose biosynthesis
LLEKTAMARSLDLIKPGDARIEGLWRQLEARSQPPYFLSWGWVENWLAALPVDETPQLAVVNEDGEPAGAFFLGRRRMRRHLVVPSNALFFNATGSPRHDELCIEHNGLLATAGARRSLGAILDLIPGEWDELFVPATDRYAFDDLGAGASLGSYRVRIDRESAAPFVDLEAVRSMEGGYISLLGASTRTQLRRTRRIVGNLDVEVAEDEHQALDIWGELLRLHAQRWAARGERGAFADPWFERFHRRLITSRLASGEIQLVRVRAGATTIGCLYNFVYRGRVLFYQSGLAAFDDPHIKPGFLCHAAAIEYNALAGHQVYDLLGGASRYKQSLATGAARLVWLRVQRQRMRFAVEDQLRKLRARLAVPRLALSTAPGS